MKVMSVEKIKFIAAGCIKLRIIDSKADVNFDLTSIMKLPIYIIKPLLNFPFILGLFSCSCMCKPSRTKHSNPSIPVSIILNVKLFLMSFDVPRCWYILCLPSVMGLACCGNLMQDSYFPILFSPRRVEDPMSVSLQCR